MTKTAVADPERPDFEATANALRAVPAKAASTAAAPPAKAARTVAAKTRQPVQTPFASIERRFALASYYWFDGKWCPAVKRNDDGTYQIRVTLSSTVRDATTTDRFGYFEINADGVVTASPRGFARDYNKTVVTGLDEAVQRFAMPDPQAARLAL